MLKKIKAAVIGDKNEMSLYAAAGVRVCDAGDSHQTLQLIAKLTTEGYGLIFVSEKLYIACGDALKKYLSSPYPIITPVPCEGSDGSYAKQRIADNIKKAIGSEII